MKNNLNYLLGLLMIGVVACTLIQPNAGPDPGWFAFNYPRTDWGPGHVFRIKNGESTPQYVIFLHSKKPLDTGSFYMPSQYQKRFTSGGGFLKFLFLNPTDTTLAGKFNKKIEVSMETGKGFSESIDEPTIDELVKGSGIHWRPNSKYYIIQSTLSSKQLRYKILNSSGLNLGLILNFKAVGSAGKIQRDVTDSTYLNQDFGSNFRIYYKAIEIIPMGAAITDNKKYSYKVVKIPVVKD